MLLAIDVGNTQTHLGVFDRDSLLYEWRASTDAGRTADELALMFGQFLALGNLSFTRSITGVAISSVVPPATQELREMTLKYFGFPPLVVEPGIKTGIGVMTDHPREVGADRIANAAAAHEMYPDEGVVVVDFGTAITVDAVSGTGKYLGGAIAPGIDTSAAALFSATAQIQRVELIAPPSAIGRNTINSVQSGVIFGTASLVDGLIERVALEMGGGENGVSVVATGGLAGTVVEHCRRVDHIEPMLTLRGLRLIFERNFPGVRDGEDEVGVPAAEPQGLRGSVSAPPGPKGGEGRHGV
ncbi:MAG: type III pantothenate kinase [Actinomycetota bacterium]|nr:type III pantothenate kinase [Actinomycetota bacterium]